MVHVAVNLGTSGRARPTSTPRVTSFVYLVGATAAIGGFLFGYDTGVVSSAMLYIPHAPGMQLDYFWEGLVISVTLGACAVFSLLAGVSNTYFGRRPTILAASALFTLGSALLAVAPNRYVLLVGRIIVGAAIGFASMTVPTYVAETTPAHIRGRMVTGFQLMITFGILCASVLGAAYSYIDPVHIGWRLMMGTAAIPSIIQLVAFLFLPESPRYLAAHGRLNDAELVLSKMYGGQADWVSYELGEIMDSLDEEAKLADEAGGSSIALVQMLRTPHVRKALILGTALQMFQQLSGVNTLMYYTATVIKMGGVRDPQTAIWMSCAVSGTNFFSTFIPMALVDRLGRRKLLLGSITGVLLSLLLLSGGFFLINRSSAKIGHRLTDEPGWTSALNASDEQATAARACARRSNCDDCVTLETCGFCYERGAETNASYGACLPARLGATETAWLGACSNASAIERSLVWASDYCESPFSWLPIVGMIAYITAFSSGYAPMPWVINSEIFPNWARSTGVAICTSSNWTFNLIISQTFLLLTEALSKSGAFLVYAGITLVAFVLFFIFVPETKGLPIEEVEKLFKSRRKVAMQEDMGMEELPGK